MRIFIICSKQFYDRIAPIREELAETGHRLTMPNCFDEPDTENKYREMGEKEHAKWKAHMIWESVKTIEQNDAVLVLNFEKNDIPNYIGGATFLEMYDAFQLGKKIFLFNPIPEGMLYDEILGFEPVILFGDLSKIV